MVGAVVQRRLEVDDRITGEHAVIHALAQTLFNGREEVLRDGAAEDVLGKDHLLALIRLELDPDVAVLAVAAGLLLVLALDLDGTADGLAERHLRLVQFRFDFIAGFQFAHDDFQLLVADAVDQKLAVFLVVDGL